MVNYIPVSTPKPLASTPFRASTFHEERSFGVASHSQLLLCPKSRISIGHLTSDALLIVREPTREAVKQVKAKQDVTSAQDLSIPH